MTKKDYVAIGQVLHNNVLNLPEQERTTIIAQVADVFQKDNPRFDRERFLRFVKSGKDVKSA